MAGVEFGGDRGEADFQIFDAAVLETLFERAGEMSAADDSRARQIDIEIAEYTAHRQPARPFFEAVELFGGKAAANDGADRRTDDHIRHDAALRQRSHDADMRKAARGAAAERETDARARHSGFRMWRR